MLIITGLGRCGSSVMTKMVQSLGYGVGNMLSYDNSLRAGMELAPAYAINRDLYDDFISRGREINLDEKIDTPYWGKISYRDRILRIDKDDVPDRPQGLVEVIKDPRFTWHPEIIKSWWNVRKDICVLYLMRDPDEVIASRKFVMDGNNGWDNFYDPKREERLDEFVEDEEEFLNALFGIGIRYELLEYPLFLKDLFLSYWALNDLGYSNSLSFKECISKWEEIIDLSLVHSFK